MLAAVLLAALSADPAYEAIKAHDELQRSERAARAAKYTPQIEAATQRLNAAEDAIVRQGVRQPASDKRPAIYPSLAAKQAAIKLEADELARLEKRRDTVLRQRLEPKWLPDELRVGHLGKVPGLELIVAQVIDDKTMLVRLPVQDITVFFKGQPTQGLSDDSRVHMADYVEVVGTQAYRTVLGAKRTAFVLQVIDPRRLRGD